MKCFFKGEHFELVKWFHGPISRARAQTLLHAGEHASKPGHFLVRFSEKCPELFTLSYLASANGRVVMRNVLVYNLGRVCSVRVGRACASSGRVTLFLRALGQHGYSVYQTAASPDRCFPCFASFVEANRAKLSFPVCVWLRVWLRVWVCVMCVGMCVRLCAPLGAVMTSSRLQLCSVQCASLLYLQCQSAIQREVSARGMFMLPWQDD